MAKNYTFAEAVKIINEGTDFESLADIGRRYPVMLQKVTKVCAKAGADFVDLMGFMPEYLTANKVNTAIKTLVAGETVNDDVSSDEVNDDTETGATKGKDYESMSGKELWDILGKAGKRKLAKSTKKADLVAACKAMDAGEEPEDDTEGNNKNEENSANAYEGKSAIELFKECKKRGIKIAPKKPAKYYAELLVKNDVESKVANKEGDDWEDGEENVKETKKEKSAAVKGAKVDKPAKKEDKDDDDDGDDWDI